MVIGGCVSREIRVFFRNYFVRKKKIYSFVNKKTNEFNECV